MTRSAHLAAALALAAAVAPAAAAEHGLAARVNGQGITRERLERYFEERLVEKGRNVAAIRSAEAFKSLKREALDELVDRELLWQDAQRRKRVVPAGDVDAAMARFREQVPDPTRRQLDLARSGFTEESYAEYVRRELSIRRLVARDIAPQVRVTAADIRDFYEANAEEFTSPPEVRARHVLVKVAPGSGAEQRADARRRIEAVLAAARSGEDMGELARKYSEDSTAESGGDLGWFPPGKMVPSFDAAAFALEPGQVSDVVETPFGFHVLRVEERRPAVPLPETEVRQEIRAHLEARRLDDAVAAHTAKLRERARIEILIALAEGR